MIQTVVAVRDLAAGAFGRPIFVVARGQAIRSFTDEVNRAAQDNEMHRHPEDFELYEIGQFDDAAGRLVPHPEVVLLLRGKDAAIPKD